MRLSALPSGLALLAALVSVPATAQVGVPLPDTLAWEFVGTHPDAPYVNVDGLGFCGDTLYVGMNGTPHVLRDGGPGYPASAGLWEELSLFSAYDVGCVSTPIQSGFYILRSPHGLRRSRDGGYTVETVLDRGETFPVPTPAGALVANFSRLDLGVCRTDDGEAWTCAPYVDLGGAFPFPQSFAAARPGGLVPAARLLANGPGGPAYSDDDGRTWQPSDLMPYGPYGAGLAVVDGGPLHGLAVATAQDAAGEFRVFQSADGASWTDIGAPPEAPQGGWRFETRLVAIPGGLVARYGDGAGLWLSGDGGRTWRGVFGINTLTDIPIFVRDVAAGPDGHVYIGVYSSSGHPDERGGVYRTTAPLVAVAGEAVPGAMPGVGVAVRPNPAGGRVEVVLSLAAAGAVRVVVLDGLGREVAVVLDGTAAAGERAVAVETRGWPAGVYVVHATAAGGGGARVASARLVVAR